MPTENMPSKFPRTKFQRVLGIMDACYPAREWVGKRNFEKAWRDCRCIAWRYWFLGELRAEMMKRDLDRTPRGADLYAELENIRSYLQNHRRAAIVTTRALNCQPTASGFTMGPLMPEIEEALENETYCLHHNAIVLEAYQLIEKHLLGKKEANAKTRP